MLTADERAAAGLAPGHWWSERSHFPRPASGCLAWLLGRTFGRAAAARWGTVYDGITFATSELGWVFSSSAAADPTDPLRRAHAAETVRTSRWRSEAARWRGETRPAVEARLLALQDEPVADLADAALAGHVERLAEVAVELWDLHFDLHFTDSVPLGMLLRAADRWGLPRGNVFALLDGCSTGSLPNPVIGELAELARSVPEASSIAELRSMSPGASELLDALLRIDGCRVISTMDVDQPTLAEQPDLLWRIVTTTRTGRRAGPPPGRDSDIRRRLKAMIPQTEWSAFDVLVDDAQLTFGVRDENAGVTGMWPTGLLRRAYLEAGLRLESAGRMARRGDVVEASPPELAAMLRGATLPAATELADRAQRRRTAWASLPPTEVGSTPSPASAPASRAASVDQQLLEDALFAYGEHYERVGDELLQGTGVGEASWTGRAVVASTPEEAMDRLQPGDVLVVEATAPAFDCVLVLASALVVELGGALSHAAIAARELGLPAVIGAMGATARIADGATVTVDPVAGRVEVVVEGASRQT